MKKIFFIDSENIGDNWLKLLENTEASAELLVFYTKNSPHMGYDSIIFLRESKREINFIQCYEGTNALDFQLVSELGFRLNESGEAEFIIVTNDTGFDAVVKYWRKRNFNIRRMTGKDCTNLERANKKLAKSIEADVAAANSVSDTESNKKADSTKPQTENTVSAESSVQKTENSDAEAVLTVFENIESKAAADTEPFPVEMTESSDKQEQNTDTAEKQKINSEPAENQKKKSEPADIQKKKSEPADIQKKKSEPADIQKKISEAAENQKKNSEAADIQKKKSDTADIQKKISETSEKQKPNSGSEEINTETVEIDSDEVDELVSCLGKEDLADLHNAFQLIYGEAAKDIYKKVKQSSYSVQNFEWDTKEKFFHYCQIVLEHTDISENYDENLISFLYNAKDKRKNLNSLRFALQASFGKDRGKKYYSVLKAHIKTLNRIK